MATSKAVVCDGQHFDSIKAFSEKYGQPKEKVTRRLAQGWSPEQAVGLAPRKRIGSTGKALTFEGKSYSSLVEASMAFGLNPKLVASRVAKGYSIDDALRGNLAGRSRNGKAITFRGEVFHSQEELAAKYSQTWRTVWKRQQRGWTLEQALGIDQAPPRFRNFEGHAREHQWKEVRVSSGKIEPIPDAQGYKLYLVTNDVNDKVYVGLTIGSLENRLKQHFAAARKGRMSAFANAIRKYGEQAFHIELLNSEARTYEELQEKEVLEIQRRDAIKNGYNTALGGSIGTSKPIKIHDKIYQSYAGAAEAFGIDPVVFALRVARLKWSPEQAVELEPRNGQGLAKHLSVNGQQFHTLKAAADAFGLQYRTVHKRFRIMGWTLEQSLGLVQAQEKTPHAAKGIVIGDSYYPSIAKAAALHGVSVHALRRYVRLGLTPEEGMRKLEGVRSFV